MGPVIKRFGAKFKDEWDSLCNRTIHVFLLSLLTLIFSPRRTLSLTLNKPVPGARFTGILSNGIATVSWVVAPGDPPFITLEIQNNVTLDSWEFASNVDITLGRITRKLNDVAGSKFYFMQAVLVSDITHVLAESPLFTVDGIAAPTTNPIPSTTDTRTITTPTTSASTTSTVQPTSITTVSPAPNQKKTGPAVKTVLPCVAVLVLLLVVGSIFYLRRRRRRRLLAAHPILVPLIHQEDYTQPLDKRGRLGQVVSEKSAAERQRDQLQMDLAARNRAERPGALSSASQADSEATLRRQVEVMSQRILELETQQRELEAYGVYPFSNEGRRQPPPDYSVTTSSRIIA
ncbi:hypothetical protein LshimejAT787_0211380 [Lyophyllum shimeji]|uniref:Uncharacterized protein n=1 Tax=Lyophyllum shimeji TaxID=47721 RepID=A0A9P3UJC9_LYOSH|nr:hypothetical protein LshimejAT787_0211380 [Lyophyllum shimeji]